MCAEVLHGAHASGITLATQGLSASGTIHPPRDAYRVRELFRDHEWSDGADKILLSGLMLDQTDH
jgi:hypothetical protein